MKYFNTFIIFILIPVTTLCLPIHSVYSHIIDSNNSQLWKKPEDNLAIQFAYKPEKPIIDSFTTLQFSVTNLQSGQNIGDSLAQVTVTNGQRLFKFQNIITQNGDFSVDYIFPDDGTHQVLLRLDNNDSIWIASFEVFVPHQTPPNILDNQSNIIIAIGILIAVAVITIIMLKKR